MVKKMIFLKGFVAHAAITSLIQDYNGLEKYIEMMREGWVDSSLSLPLALCGLAWALFDTTIRPEEQHGKSSL